MSKKSDSTYLKYNEDRERKGLAPFSRREFLNALALGVAVPFAACVDGDENVHQSMGDAGGGSTKEEPDRDSTQYQGDTEDTGPGDTHSDTSEPVDKDTGTGPEAAPDSGSNPTDDNGKSKIFVISTEDRLTGLEQLLDMADLSFAKGKKVVLKPNFNSSNAFPASTHDNTIRGVVTALKNAGAGEMILGESSGPSGTNSVVNAKGTRALCQEIGCEFVSFDAMPQSDWENFNFQGMNWPGGLAIPKMFREDNGIVLLPCCKTHAFGGQFTLSLKLAVGMTPRARRNAMHAAPRIRAWIADINKGFTPDLIVMDAIRVFTSGGPDSGTAANPKLLVAGSDRIAIDAVGLAILSRAGSNVINNRKIFKQDQIARAVELGLGVTSPDDITLEGNDPTVISELRGILDNG